MFGLVLAEYGDPSVLEWKELPEPSVGPTEILVKVKAAGVNPVDVKLRQGNLKLFLPVTLPHVLGLDYAGTIEKVGNQVQDWKVGDQVFGLIKAGGSNGTYAEYTLVRPEKGDVCAKVPLGTSLEQAGGTATVAITALTCLDYGKVKAQDKVLIIGASGGVGSWTVQLAKARKAHVIGICSAKNVDYVKGLGADQVLDYTHAEFESQLKALVDLDLVVDAVGGDEYWKLTDPLLKKGGVYCTAVGPVKHGGEDPVTIGQILSTAAKLIGRNVFCKTSYTMVTSLATHLFPQIVQGLENGFKPLPLNTFDMKTQAAQAHTLMQSNRAVGKVVLTI